MRAAQIQSLGTLATAAEVDEPGPPEGDEVLVRMHVAALNPFDIEVAAGVHPHGRPTTPYVPGVEGVGTVVAGDSSVIGTRVRVHGAGGFGPGTLAELVRVPSAACARIDPALADEQAVAIGMAGITAVQALERARLEPDSTLLILGATGSVGRAVMQVARARGVKAIIAAGRDRGALERLRADATVDLEHGDWDEAIGAVGGQVDVVVDILWGDYAMEAMRRLAFGGRLISIGSAASRTAAIDSGVIRRRHATLLGFSMPDLTFDEVATSYAQVVDLAVRRELELPVTAFDLADVTQAWGAQTDTGTSKVTVGIAPRVPTP